MVKQAGGESIRNVWGIGNEKLYFDSVLAFNSFNCFRACAMRVSVQAHDVITRNVTCALHLYGGVVLQRRNYAHIFRYSESKIDLPRCLVVFAVIISLIKPIRSPLGGLELFRFSTSIRESRFTQSRHELGRPDQTIRKNCLRWVACARTLSKTERPF